jgi:hypothetical protein
MINYAHKLCVAAVLALSATEVTATTLTQVSDQLPSQAEALQQRVKEIFERQGGIDGLLGRFDVLAQSKSGASLPPLADILSRAGLDGVTKEDARQMFRDLVKGPV